MLLTSGEERDPEGTDRAPPVLLVSFHARNLMKIQRLITFGTSSGQCWGTCLSFISEEKFFTDEGRRRPAGHVLV